MLDLTRSARASDTHGDPGMPQTPHLRPIHATSVSSTEKSKMPARNLAMLYYKVPWPLMVVSPESAVAQYQAFFKHLFDLKWVERELNKTCKLYQATRNLANFERRALRRQSIPGGTDKVDGAGRKQEPTAVPVQRCHKQSHARLQHVSEHGALFQGVPAVLFVRAPGPALEVARGQPQ